MARKPRIVVPGKPHHVIVRGNNRRTLFSYPTDYKKFISCVRVALEQTGCSLHAMTMMSNHVHLIVTPPDIESLSRFVQRFSQRYAQYRNGRRKATGKLFEQRYRSYPILELKYLAVVTVYVEVNAWRSDKVSDPMDYSWSTFAIHAGEPEKSSIPSEMWTPSDWYLGLGRDDAERVSGFMDRVRQFYLGPEAPPSAEDIKKIEKLSSDRYKKRLERPDRRGAR